MQIHHICTKLTRALAFCALGCALVGSAQAYQTKEVFKTEHFAIHEVILDAHDVMDVGLQKSITRDVQTQNRLDKLYQASAVIFPHGSQGFKSKINAKIEGVLTVAAWGSGTDRIFFNRKARHLSEGGLYLSFAQLVEIMNQKALNPLLSELQKIPVVFTNVPVTATGIDPVTGGFSITTARQGVIFDMRIDDSVYYKKSDYATLRKGCRVNLLTFCDRIIPNIPFFVAGRAALNYLDCSRAPRVSENQEPQSFSATPTSSASQSKPSTLQQSRYQEAPRMSHPSYNNIENM